MTQSTNFQDIMLILQHFWAEKSCIIWQPYHTEVGAGTMNPGTSLRVLGPEPWNVAYVEPSIRPDDGRYGENPNRLNQHYQFQVILKPDPGNPQDLYLQSLMALGIEPRKHDIRFVEDNWEYPALGAWGLGWEVWLDGLEITQFTYFQQSGGLNLDPVSVELTYGLERIAMALQGVRDFKDIRWNDQLTYGDVNLESEQEFSKYNFELADVEKLRQFFEMYEDEAIVCIENHQVLPAHDYMLKCSQTFNILDTRGAVGVTERQAYFRRMRKLARKIAKAYVEQRQRMEFPWLDEQTYSNGKGISQGIEFTSSKISGSADFLLEIGTEELPPGDATDAIQQLEKAIPLSLEHLRLEHHGIDILATPRRLVVLIKELAGQQSDLEEEVKGPPAERAFDQDGNPTKAAIGFASSRGLQVEQLQVKDIDGGQYVVAAVQQAGESSIKVLSETLHEWIAGIKFGKTMRWNESNVAFSRPIRWLLAMHGSQVIPFEYAGVRSSNQTQGLRFYKPEKITVNSISEYFDGLSRQGIILDPEQRKLEIRSQIETLTAEINAEVPTDEDLLNEVTFLVEAPTSLMGEYESEYLQLPHEVLVSVMKKHQRYFPVQMDGKLTNRFITVRNGDDQHLDLVRQGNADVIRARFADAAYFVREDQEHKLEDFLPQLDRLTFQVELGSMLDKSRRITSLTEKLSDHLGLSAEDKANAVRAAELCKADLATLMVIEMTSLQGTMGRDYALNSGEKLEVAEAIYEHYLPRTSDGEAPKTKPGLVVGIADRLDSLTGLFAAGLEPSGNKDPFAQRRMALGLVGNLIEWELDFDVQAGIGMSAELQPISVDADSKKAVLSFIIERMRNLFLDQGYRYDIVEAVLRKQGNNPIKAKAAVDALAAWVDSENWNEILPAYSRCVRITRDLEETFTVSPDLFEDPAETQLYEALRKVELVDREPGSVDGFFEAFNPMIPAINQFFDDVLVMVDEEDIRQNRLGLLQRIADLAEDVADFSMLEGF